MSSSLLTTAEAARRLGVSASTIRRWAEEGELESRRTPGGHRRYAAEAVDSLRTRVISEADDGFAEAWTRALVTAEDPHETLGDLYGERARRGTWWKVAQAFEPVVERLTLAPGAGHMSSLQADLAARRLERALERIAEDLPTDPTGPACAIGGPAGMDITLPLASTELVAREARWPTMNLGTGLRARDLAEYLPHPRLDRLILVHAAPQCGPADLAEWLGPVMTAARPLRRLVILLGPGWGKVPEGAVQVANLNGLMPYLRRTQA